jgi:hypothetical protein
LSLKWGMIEYRYCLSESLNACVSRSFTADEAEEEQLEEFILNFNLDNLEGVMIAFSLTFRSVTK